MVACAGCGTGSLSIPLALQGADVYGSDISKADEAARRYQEQSRAEGSGQRAAPRFEAQDLESLTGSYNTVCCIDVLIHYPPVRPAIRKLCSQSISSKLVACHPWLHTYENV